MALANASTYAPDDAARDASGNMIIEQQSLYRVRPQHPAGASVGAPMPLWVPLAVIGGFLYWWSRRG